MAPRSQSNSDLLQHLTEQVGFLTRSCKAFDDGAEEEAKRIAATLRLLLHETKWSKALFGQLGLTGKPFVSTANRMPPRDAMFQSWMRLTVMEMSQEHATYLARCRAPAELMQRRGQPFEDWWNDTVIIIGAPRMDFTRQQLVLDIADQDGGVHVDPEIRDEYARLTRDAASGWIYRSRDGSSWAVTGAELATVRQVAFEVIETLRRYHPGVIAAHEEKRSTRAERRRRP